jgi:hypothetical protein
MRTNSTPAANAAVKVVVARNTSKTATVRPAQSAAFKSPGTRTTRAVIAALLGL